MNISGNATVSGIIGSQNWDSNQTIVNSRVYESKISGYLAVGGIIGLCFNKLYLTNTHITFLHISVVSEFGVVVGSDNNGTYSFINSTTTSNFVNGAKQTDCASLSNTWSISGC
ncbi:Hypothetical_protein [Hexamita inflata]|uniref:Hypothetical_protein n=1 Tax=Hexamita inflata TaxID=28002 RepID=A0AA86QBN3_9EUKA|nr:Hypothetical protein HINF_LOCUS43490 [Hexamita inflata]